jgi:hypothetical protein
MPLTAGRRAGFSLPDLPRLGGVGPIAWRQLLTAFRSLRGLIVILIILGLLLAQALVFGGRSAVPNVFLPRVLAGTAFATSIFLLQMLPFDFRGDVDRMEVLKALPVPPLGIVVGQLVTPVLISCVVQLVGLLAVQVLLGGLGVAFLVAAAVFTVPFNFMLFEIVNLLFLIFPTRTTVASAGDLQVIGRQTLLLIAIWFSLLTLLGIAALVGGIVYLITRSWPITLASAWCVLAALDVALLPLLVVGFQRFDVARDTPP